jgi:hypothetical protein
MSRDFSEVGDYIALYIRKIILVTLHRLIEANVMPPTYQTMH